MRTRKIYYLETTANTYMRRHDLYNAGVRWDAKAKRWWALTKTPVAKAASMLENSDAQAVAVHVQKLPNVGKTFRGGRPRKPRTANGQVPMPTEQPVELAPPGSPPLAVSGSPFVRGRTGEDRRKREDRRDEGTRPDAVLVVPMAAEAPPMMQKA